MKFIKVDHSLNKRFFVEDLAFKDLIDKIIKRQKGVTLESSEVKVNSKSSSFIAKIWVSIKPKQSYAKAAKEIQAQLEEGALLLTNVKPENIQIFFKEGE